MIDKSKELNVRLDLIDEKVHFQGRTADQQPVSIDYFPPLGSNNGNTSLELFLMSLGSCLGSSLLIMLRRMGKEILSCKIDSKGFRRAEHPTGFYRIEMEFRIGSPNTSDADLQKVALTAEKAYCPVLSMLKEDIEIATTYFVED